MECDGATTGRPVVGTNTIAGGGSGGCGVESAIGAMNGVCCAERSILRMPNVQTVLDVSNPVAKAVPL